MISWITMLVSATLLPLIMIIFSIVIKKNLPKRNRLVGYRTKLSLSSDEAWEFANKTLASSWIKIGPVVGIIAIIAMMFVPKEDSTAAIYGSIIMAVELVALLIPVFKIEAELKKKYG